MINPNEFYLRQIFRKNLKQIFEYAASYSAFLESEVIVLHVMEDVGGKVEKQMKMIAGETVYQDLKKIKRTGKFNC